MHEDGFKAAFLAATLGAWACFGQTPDVLGANPRETAWAAYTIAREHRSEMIPNLAALIGAYQGGPIPDRGSMPPEAAAVEAVADALIQLEATLPAETVMHLYPQFPAQTIILLARASENTAPLLEIFRTTASRDLWLAAGNLLALHPTPEFVRSLLSGFVASFAFRVVPPSSDAWGNGVSSGCAGDFGMGHDKAFEDWPKARMYRLITSEHSGNVFAPGIHPVGYGTWETIDYRDSWTDGDCSPGKSWDWRIGLIAQLQGKNLDDFPLKPETHEMVRYSSAASFENEVQAAIEAQSNAFREVVASFVQQGLLQTEDAADVHLRCRIQVLDARPGPREELPSVEGRWCAPAPPKTEGLGPPE